MRPPSQKMQTTAMMVAPRHRLQRRRMTAQLVLTAPSAIAVTHRYAPGQHNADFHATASPPSSPQHLKTMYHPHIDGPRAAPAAKPAGKAAPPRKRCP